MTVQCTHSKLGALISLGVLALTVHAHGQVINTVAGNGTPGGQFSQAAYEDRYLYDSTFAGDGGPASEASLLVPDAVSVDANGNVFIADTANQPDHLEANIKSLLAPPLPAEDVRKLKSLFGTLVDVGLDAPGTVKPVS